MRVLIIGGTGFIGPHIVRALSEAGHETVLFHRGQTNRRPPNHPPCGEILGDRCRLREYAACLRDVSPDIVVDVVLSSGRQAYDLMSVFRGTASRVVALSSGDVYRACAVTHRLEEGPLQSVPLTESSALRSTLHTYPPAQIQMLQQVFGWLDDQYDKIPVERAICGDPDLPGTVLRLPMVYGPGDPLRRFFPIVKRVRDGRRSILFSSSMASWRATKGYVENVGRAIAMAAVSPVAAGRIYNVGEPDSITELEWARAIASTMQWDGDFVMMPDESVPPFLRAPGNTAQHWTTDTSRLRNDLGFSEPISRHEGIRRTVEWELVHPPSGFSPHQFDYPAEDAAIGSH